ncbi:MAG: hypothetical protein M5U14_18055 [Acidimicrobiia bacterium]|nr:hypothetical protein [Acidimicrobiia bacterium]
MKGATVISWGPPVRGRERQSLEVFGRALTFYDDLAKEGRIEGHREYFNLIGAAGGMMLVEGDLEELLALQAEEETRRLHAEASSIVEGFRVELCMGGNEQSVQEAMGTYTGVMEALALL